MPLDSSKVSDVCATSQGVREAAKFPIDPDDGYVEARSARRQWAEYVLMCLCNVAWTIDAAILPLFYKEYQDLFHVSQTQLSMLSTVKGWTAAAFSFPCGFLGEMLPRPQLIGAGMLFWATGLVVCSMASSFEMLFIGRVLNGMGLGVVQPLLLSLVADKNPPTKRGSAFGSLFFVGQVCNTLFGFVATSFANVTVFGVQGWRVSVMALAAFSSIIGAAVLAWIQEPHAGELAQRARAGMCSVFVKNLPKVWQLFTYPTFVLILCQGAPGSAPWTVFPFFTQWLELSCFTHTQTAWIFSMFNWGNAFSNLLGGFLLNLVARRFPDHGPPTIANFSVAIGIPFLLLFFYILPKPAHMGGGSGEVPVYCLAFLFFGLGASMCGTVNKKVFSDVVPPTIFTYVFAVDALIEQGVGNLATLAVGVVTDKVFHYDASAAESGDCAPEQASRLGQGMFWVCTVAWAVCFTVYLGMQCTYPRDRRRQLALHATDISAKGQACDA